MTNAFLLTENTQLYLVQTKLAYQRLVLLRFFQICNIFPIIDDCRFLSTSAIGPDILMKVVTFLVWAGFVLFNFILSKNKFSVWSFTESASFISFHEGIWSVTKAHWKKCRSPLATSSITKLFASLGIHYSNSLNTDMQKQNET